MKDSDEIYSIMFSSLKHPVRRKILRMLSEKPMSFSQMLDELAVSSSHLTYHLENLGELVSKSDEGEYGLSTFGSASVETMRIVEEAPAVQSKRRWFLPFKWRAVLAALVIGLVLIACLFYVQNGALSQISTEQEQLKWSYNQLLSWSSGTNDAVAFIRDVIQIDITKYHATLLSNTVESRSDLGGVVEEIMRYSLVSTDSKCDVMLRFRNGKMSMYQLNLLEGNQVYFQSKPETDAESAKYLLEKLKTLENAPYFDDMNKMLALANTAENIEITQNNTKLSATFSGETTKIDWFYTANDIDFSQKGVHLTYENGILKEFTDGWFLLKIGSTEVNFSSKQAIEIARNAVKNYTWTANDGTVVSNFNVLDEPVSVELHPTQREEYLTIIPHWYVSLYLDKVYPGGVNCIGVGVWADTGKVASIKTLSG